MPSQGTLVESTSAANNEPSSRKENPFMTRKRWWPFLVAPFVVGLAWTSVHPVLSIITGEPKCRGWYIDESALDPSHFQNEIPYPVPSTVGVKPGSSSLCETLLRLGDKATSDVSDRMSCFHHEKGKFDVARLIPASNAVQPTAEVLVVVVPAPTTTWNESILHASLLHLMNRLSDTQATPWLAKTVLFVSSATRDVSVNDTVTSFLDSYLGVASSADVVSPSLPPTYTCGIIRNLLVFDAIIEKDTNGPSELQILPQGRRGVLPNLDLVFAIMATYSKAQFMAKIRHPPRQHPTTFYMHPYGTLAQEWEQRVKSYCPTSLWEGATDLGNMLLFAYSLVLGPYLPHAPVLERGIDAVSINAKLDTRSQQAFVPEYVQKLEYLIHALSNLHERLHHSITQYLLPSPTKFVSHSEYLLPTILLLLPLVLRAALLALLQLKRFHLRSLRMALLAVCLALPIGLVSERVEVSNLNALYVMVYASIMAIARDLISKDQKEARQTIQFLSCLVAIYVHVPITLAHVSLAYPSALMWTPMLAFPSFNGKETGLFQKTVACIILLVMWPPFTLVPNIFTSYTPYVTLVYTPLHILLCLLWLG